MNQAAHVLVVDDEQELLQLVVTYLKNEEYVVYTATDGHEALQTLEQQSIDLVILDIMMEGMDGFELCKRIRTTSQIPVVMLTAKSSEDDRIRGLKLGADDYVVKPFSPRELMARVEAVLRRMNVGQTDVNKIEIAELVIEKNGRKVFVGGHLVNLTRKEYDLLVFLLESSGQVFTRDHLLMRLWDIDHNKTARTVDTHVKTLRLKLQTAGRFIQTVWGVGYKFEDPS
ncbi:response regulator transcription factor [Alkalicoccobacillus murimartini]|uniref:Two-component system OmpR family response regulator n=1 Tax=Alkalicoccobacillus murimartini TaxID=171685 RepID=A0ABT9YF25_9BACI|nr:response regulator transcription factor [Alkalicoccobacillus murimartini]MDQ0205664.1 two-component system OmpR family response regulator [Alkalicoccobacillus murimartini]